MNLEYEKIINRVKKLLALSNDTSSPNEAAIALKRVRSLMDKYQLTHEDILTEENALLESGEKKE